MIGLEFINVTKNYGPTIALNGLSMEIEPGSVLGLVGPNGAGKTTLLNIASGFIRNYKGSMQIKPEDSSVLSEDVQPGVFPQDTALPWGKNISELVKYMSDLSRVYAGNNEMRCPPDNALEMTGMLPLADRSPAELSHGQMARVALAMAFSGPSGLLLLDEPTAGMDPAAAKKVRDLLKKMKGKETVIISSHDLTGLEGICTHIAFISKGRLTRYGSVDEILLAGNIIRYELDNSVTEDFLKNIKGVRKVTISEGGHIADVEIDSSEITVNDFNKLAMPEILKKGLVSMRKGRPLEDAFLNQ